VPSVRRMLLRRTEDRAAADRVERLLGAARTGWTPPPEDEEPTSGWYRGVDSSPSSEPDPAPEPHQDPEPEPDRSWAAARDGQVPRRIRLDPGRRGAVALVVVAALAAVVSTGVVLRGRPQEVPVPVLESGGVPLPGVSAAPADGAAEVVVAVAGKVRRPGLVRLPAGSRVDDALRAAGGATDAAAIGMLNLARRLVDGEQVLVGVDPPPGQPASGGAVAGGLLDLNAATAADLQALPGIGPVLAQRIVDWRTAHGPFDSVDQLREVTGIGEAKYDDLRAKVTVP
jgi:competence protein ComEA